MTPETAMVLGTIGLVAFLSYITYHLIIHIRRKRIVKETSDLLKKLNEINESSNFHKDIKTQYTQCKKMPSKVKYDRYQCSELRDEILIDAFHPLQQDLRKVKENLTKYEAYLPKVKSLKSQMTPEAAKQLNVPYEKYCKIENSLFKERQLKPVLDGMLTCTVEYTSPAGRNHYSKSDTYSYTYVIQRLDELQKMLKQRESEEFKRKIERSKVTPKLRLAVIERDGRRCQICGARQEDGATLHVDHIIPVAKGGKTEMSNLRTLCDMCNQGKSDQILENDFAKAMDKD